MRSLVSQRRWRLKELSEERAGAIARALGCSAPLARVLAARAPDNPLELLDSAREPFQAPWRLRGVYEAVLRIDQALRRNEKIFIQGDFDVDGITSTAVLYKALRTLGARGIKVDLSDRARGHGLSDAVIHRLKAEGFSLLITADCGISEFDWIAHLQEHGIDVIISDHHHPPERLPPAYAIINPKQPGCPYPNKDLAAVGVAFQLVRALYEYRGLPAQASEEFLDLVLLGTVGDLVPLVRDGQAENKRLVAHGLRRIAQGQMCLGLRVLMEKLSLDPQRLTTGEVSYIIVPRLNAANRVGDPRDAFMLLITSLPTRAEQLATKLLAYNQDRQIAQDDLLYQAEEQLRSRPHWQSQKLIFLAGRYWNPGLIGLVASDLAEKYYRPTVLVSIEDEFSRASCRSIPGFDIIEALARHSDLLERYGGHSMAAGFFIRTERLPILQERLCAYAQEILRDLGDPVHELETELSPEEITLETYSDILRLAPFGMGHPTPRFLLRSAKIKELRTVGNGSQHLKLRIEAGGREFSAIGFSLGEFAYEVERAGTVGLAFKLGCDTWTGRPQVQLELEDILEPCT
ncbi:MAG: single-stranded-DNA-specific exonuclease RecJ [Candidatus Bipolaricaulota bacterium]|nr:single-stranded-DNA-specific exonuclease RecJ [Candidatus Bipolaricaulota bacterium]